MLCYGCIVVLLYDVYCYCFVFLIQESHCFFVFKNYDCLNIIVAYIVPYVKASISKGDK